MSETDKTLAFILGMIGALALIGVLIFTDLGSDVSEWFQEGVPIYQENPCAVVRCNP